MKGYILKMKKYQQMALNIYNGPDFVLFLKPNIGFNSRSKVRRGEQYCSIYVWPELLLILALLVWLNDFQSWCSTILSTINGFRSPVHPVYRGELKAVNKLDSLRAKREQVQSIREHFSIPDWVWTQWSEETCLTIASEQSIDFEAEMQHESYSPIHLLKAGYGENLSDEGATQSSNDPTLLRNLDILKTLLKHIVVWLQHCGFFALYFFVWVEN